MQKRNPKPAQLLVDYVEVFTEGMPPGPILDLASGDCRNGIFLAKQGLPVICCDRSSHALDRARELAAEQGVTVGYWRADLELEGGNPLPESFYGGVLVFRYLHRPLIPYIKKALKGGGIVMYETFTHEQPRFGRPHNPDYLLGSGELRQSFHDWKIIHYFEGVQENPMRAIAQIVCRKQGCIKHQGNDTP